MEKNETKRSVFVLNRLMLGFFMLLVAVTPMIVLPWTSELFEIPKMLFVFWIVTAMVVIWLLYWPLSGKLPWRKSPLDLLIAFFLLSQILSTVLSIHPYTSFWGWYTRMNGGLSSTLAYLIAFYLALATLDKDQVKLLIKTAVWFSLPIVIYGILQHWGIDAHLWVQDAKARVFATFGQTNWLAAYTAIMSPLSLAVAMDYATKKDHGNNWLRWIYYPLPVLLFLVLTYTKSRSGYLGFWFADIIFWFGGWQILKAKNSNWVDLLKKMFVMIHLAYLLIILVAGTPFTLRASQVMNKHQLSYASSDVTTPGSSTAEIRKVVWKGAIKLGMKFPIWGTGLETFGYTYYWVRPVEHNMLSEWYFLYNKAHNEYLNIFANAGLLGLTTEILLICAFVMMAGWGLFAKKTNGISNWKTKFSFLLNKILRTEHTALVLNKDADQIYLVALLAAYVSILVTNFFGFSVVVTAIYWFLLPAFWVVLYVEPKYIDLLKWAKGKFKWLAFVLIFAVWLISGYVVTNVFYFLQADLEYKTASRLLYADQLENATLIIDQAISKIPKEARYYDLGAEIFADRAVVGYFNNSKLTGIYVQNAIKYGNKALELNKWDLNILKNQSSMYTTLAIIDPQYYARSIDILTKAEKLSPTDPKILYNLALLYARQGNKPHGVELLKKSLQLKPDYAEALYGLALFTYEDGLNSDSQIADKSKLQAAIDYLEQLLRYDPNHKQAQQKLSEWQTQLKNMN